MHFLSDTGTVRALHSDGQVARPRQQSLDIRRDQTRGNSFPVRGTVGKLCFLDPELFGIDPDLQMKNTSD